jgi:hypothetical protein
MENINNNFHPMNTRLYTFDLKGSFINRRDQIKKGKILKCLNFVDINSSKKKVVRLDIDQIDEIYDLIEADTQFLRRMRIMDYSLLLVVEQVKSKLQSAYRFENLTRNEYKSYDSSMIYHLGIIDFLQQWTFTKKLEAFARSKLLMRDPWLNSCIRPSMY